MYKKFSSQRVFNGTSLLTGGNTVIVADSGMVVDVVAGVAEDAVWCEGILSPGFVNAHCHLELSHLKGKVAEGTGLVQFVQEIMKNKGGEPEVVRKAIINACEEMYQSGINGVGDICNTADTAFIKNEPGITWRNFIEISGFVSATAVQRMQQAEAVLRELPNGIITPHAPYSVSGRLFSLISHRQPRVISVHNQETKEEDKFFKNKTGEFLSLYSNIGVRIDEFIPPGKSSFQTWLPYFANTPEVISVHNTFTEEADILFSTSQRGNIWFCLCPGANQYIERSLPPVELFLQHSCKMVVGTDSLASNHQLSIAAELKMLQQSFPIISLQMLLQWATANGADALGFDHLGYLGKGRRPGLIEVHTDEKGILTGTVSRIY